MEELRKKNEIKASKRTRTGNLLKDTEEQIKSTKRKKKSALQAKRDIRFWIFVLL